MKKYLVLFTALFFVVGLAAGCSKSKKDDCEDVSKKFCEKLDKCGFLDVSVERCTQILTDSAKADDTSDKECRDEWNGVKDASCQQLAEM